MQPMEEKRRKTFHETNGPVQQHIDAERERIDRSGDEVDIASDDSFPASDPPSHTPIKGERHKDHRRKK